MERCNMLINLVKRLDEGEQSYCVLTTNFDSVPPTATVKIDGIIKKITVEMEYA